jgi:hypothetical protein
VILLNRREDMTELPVGISAEKYLISHFGPRKRRGSLRDPGSNLWVPKKYRFLIILTPRCRIRPAASNTPLLGRIFIAVRLTSDQTCLTGDAPISVSYH